MNENQIIENTLEHFPQGIGKGINDYVINEVLYHSRYMFVTKEGNKRYGFCTHCKSEREVYGLKHKEHTHCDNCKSVCRVQLAGYGRSQMIDQAYIVYYEKSEINSEAMIARGFNVWMDYTGDYKNVKPIYKTLAYYLFEMDNPVFLKKNSWFRGNEHNLELRKTTFSLFAEYTSFGMISHAIQKVSVKSIIEAVKDTPFQYSMWSNRNAHDSTDDFVRYFATYSKHPQIEYLYKLGFGHLVEKKVNNQPMGWTINWRGKTLDKVLKVPKQHLKDFIKNARVVDTFVLTVFQHGQKEGSNLTIDECLEMKQNNMDWEWDDFKIASIGIGMRKLINYLKKQLKKDEESESEESDPYGVIVDRSSFRQMFIQLKDYWEGSKRLDLRPGIDIVEYPSNLVRAHDNIFRQIKFKEDKELDEQIKMRLDYLSKFIYENDQFIIRPFSSTKEIIAEGKALKHCIGNYTDRYARGKTDILAIRKKDNPEEPYYTLEVIDNEVRQFYGYGNNTKIKKSKEIIAFVEEFQKEVLNKEKENKKENVA